MSTGTLDTADAVRRNTAHDEVPREKKLHDLYALIDKVEIAMLTTVELDGSLVSRPMATIASGADSVADVTFMTSTETGKVDALQQSPHVNVGYLRSSSKEWVSLSGTARLSQDRARIKSLYKSSWKAWLGDEGAPKDGGPDDPRIILIDVMADDVTYFKVDEPRPVVLFKVAKAMVTGEPPKVGDLRHLDGAQR